MFLKRKNKNKYVLHIKPDAYDEAVLAWVAPEMVRHERGVIWNIVALTITSGLIFWGLVSEAWTFSLVTVTAAVVYYLLNLEHPRDVEIKISNVGIKVGARKYPFGRIKAFWIHYEPPYLKTLNIRVSGEIASDITIQMDGQSPAPVREFLLEKIPELEGQNEKLSDIILRILKL